MNLLARIGFNSRKTLLGIGQATQLLIQLVASFGTCFSRFHLLREQIFYLGNRSLLIMALCAAFVGFVMGLQFHYGLSMFGSTEVLGFIVALSLFRELGAVLTALLFAGRAGTALTAEIGLMRTGEQLAAMEMMAVNPIKRILAPRFWAVVIVVPLLTAIFNLVAVLGSWLVSVVMLGVDNGSFWGQMQDKIDLVTDLATGLFKSLVFAIVISLVALFNGYSAKPTPEGVAYATTNTVVLASVLVLLADFILTALLYTF